MLPRSLLRRPRRTHRRSRSPRRTLTTTVPRLNNYAATLPNLHIGPHTRVLFQGFTGRLATANAAESLAWGTNIVGGTKPGFTGEHLGLPVLPTVRAAVAELRPDATAVYIPAARAADAIEESVEAEIPLIVAVAEHIPLHAMLRVHSLLKTQSRSRLVGANSPGVISATGRCRIGFQPLSCFSPGVVGMAARSGTMSYEAVAATTAAGLGQSLCIGVGGDLIVGTDLREALEVLVEDKQTEAIALIGEIGGTGEMEAAEWIREYHSREPNPKPIAAVIAGVTAVPGKVMGHAGAIMMAGEPDARQKIQALEDAGVTIVNHPEKIGEALKARLQDRGNQMGSSSSGFSAQRRGLHTAARRVRPSKPATLLMKDQRRNIVISENHAFDMLRNRGFNVAEYSGRGTRRLLAVGVDRTQRTPCIIASPSVDPDTMYRQARTFVFDYRAGVDGLRANRIVEQLQLGHRSADSLRKFIIGLVDLFYEKQAVLLETKIVERLGELKVVNAHFELNEAAFRNNVPGMQALQAMRDPSSQDPIALEGEKHGIVYVRYPENGNIGTLVNGAGLSMITTDALVDLGGECANFLDTGGLATSETIRKSFEMILKDPRVRVIFVNVFGGLTLGDMIARGIVMAFTDMRLTIPVVVRIRGTGEKEGRAIIDESGLPLYAFENFEEAAKKAIELSRR